MAGDAGITTSKGNCAFQSSTKEFFCGPSVESASQDLFWVDVSHDLTPGGMGEAVLTGSIQLVFDQGPVHGRFVLRLQAFNSSYGDRDSSSLDLV